MVSLAQLAWHQGLRDGGVVHVGLARGAVQLPGGRARDGLGDGVGLDLETYQEMRISRDDGVGLDLDHMATWGPVHLNIMLAQTDMGG